MSPANLAASITATGTSAMITDSEYRYGESTLRPKNILRGVKTTIAMSSTEIDDAMLRCLLLNTPILKSDFSDLIL